MMRCSTTVSLALSLSGLLAFTSVAFAATNYVGLRRALKLNNISEHAHATPQQVIGSLDHADSRNNRIEISGGGHLRSDETKEQFIGEVSLVIGGEERRATITLTVIEPFAPRGDGGQTATTAHRFDLGDGNTFTTSEKLNVTPSETTERQSVNSVLAVTGGTGVFANARGNLALHGSISANHESADWNVNGTIED